MTITLFDCTFSLEEQVYLRRRLFDGPLPYEGFESVFREEVIMTVRGEG